MLAYDQPIGETRSGGAQPTPRTSAGFSVLELGRLLWRRRIAIMGAALIGACAAVAIGKGLSPKYLATAQLYVDPRELQLVDRELTPRAQDVSGLSMVVESQARLITSNNVLLQVIRNTNLDRDPEFGGVSKSIFGVLLGLFGVEMPVADPTKVEQMSALDALNRHVTVKKTDRSFIVDIDVWSRDPAKAAMLANALAQTYLTESRNSQATAARRATTDLSGRLIELKERLRKAENALAVYKAQNNFVGTQDTLISDQQLSASNQRLAAARAATLDAQAKYDQIIASRRAATDNGAIPEALQSPTIANLRAQYAEARKRFAELAGELGPLHPSLRQMEKQVEDLRRTINEEVDRYATSANNDLTRARDYEASLNKALNAQKDQSVQMSQASVRLRELERDVEASRDVYQAFLKRSRETEEQESLNTSSARIIGEATVPQRRSFPPAMSLLAMVGFMFGAFAAAAWAVIAGQLSAETEASPVKPAATPLAPAPKPPAEKPLSAPSRRPQRAPASIEKPVIARLQESDVVRTLGGILASGGIPDVTRMGWPTLRAGFPMTTFLNAMRDMCAPLAQRSPANATPVMAVIGTGPAKDRSIVALNIALAAARDGAKVLLIDADHAAHALSDKLNRPGKAEAGRINWLNVGTTASRTIETTNGISVLPAITASDVKSGEAIQKAIAQARAEGGYELVILDGPAMPWSAADRKLFNVAAGLVAILPASLDINDSMEKIITALGGAERKLIGAVINELQPATFERQRDKQYA
jgi:polysaccharide biosynthesis transport protein